MAQYITLANNTYRIIKDEDSSRRIRIGQRDNLVVWDEELVEDGFTLDVENTSWKNINGYGDEVTGANVRFGVRDGDWVVDIELTGTGFLGDEDTDWVYLGGISMLSSDPLFLTATPISTTRIDLSWTGISSTIQRSTDGVNYTSIGIGSTSFSDTTCVAGTLYYYKVNGVVVSEYSLGYSVAEIEAKIAAGYIPIADPADLHALDTTYSGGSTRNFAVGTPYETGEINTTGRAGNYIQVADIDLDHTAMTAAYGATWYNATTGWPSIGVYSTGDFTGILDGGEHSISNLYIRTSDAIKGLFAGTLGGSLKNIRLLSVDVASTQAAVAYLGALAGITRDTDIINVEVTGTVSCSVGDYVGGVTGYVLKSTRNALYNKVSFNGTVVGEARVGGIIGSAANYAIKMTNCYALGSVTGTDRVGGLFGHAQYLNTTEFCGIYDSYAACVITGDTNVGGAVGYSSFMTIDEVYYDETVSGMSDTDRGYPRSTSQLKTPLTYTQTVDAEIVYDAWSGYIWDFGTISDYPVFRKRKIDKPAIADFMTAWTKYESNPVFVPAGREIYPVSVIKVGTRIYLIGKMNDNKIGHVYSDDGISFTEIDPILIESDLPVGWKEFGKYEYNSWIFRDGLYYIIFGVVFSDLTSGVGYATSSTVNGEYTINPTMILDPDNNTTNTVLGIDFTYLTAPEGFRVGDTWYWYLTAQKNDSFYILHYTSPNSDWLNWTLQRVLFNGGDFNYLVDRISNRPGNCIQIPRVYYQDGYYYMTMTIGSLDNVVNQRYIYVFKSATPDGFSIDNWQRTPIITPDAGDDKWNELRVYCHDILKVNDDYRLTPLLIDGKIQMYFSGHSFNPGYFPVLTGVPGLATLTP